MIISVMPMLSDQWLLYKAVRCAALADAPYAFSATLESALSRSDEEWAALTRQRASDPRSVTFFAFAGDASCGMAACLLEGVEAEMAAVWVAPDHRRRGVGVALVQFASQWARAHDVGRLHVGVFDDNAAALHFYRSVGFRDTGRVKSELSTENRKVRLLAMNIVDGLA